MELELDKRWKDRKDLGSGIFRIDPNFIFPYTRGKYTLQCYAVNGLYSYLAYVSGRTHAVFSTVIYTTVSEAEAEMDCWLASSQSA